jgi:hypothetical protein
MLPECENFYRHGKVTCFRLSSDARFKDAAAAFMQKRRSLGGERIEPEHQ